MIKSLFETGGALLKEEHASKETEKVGVLRGGSVGLYDEGTNTFTGTCPRRAFLRYKGVDVIEDDVGASDRTLMFEAGVTNEDSWYKRLVKSWQGVILREEEIQIAWSMDGTPVTGRPDIVLCDKSSTPQYGVELKLVSSLWTARDVLSNSPKTIHLIQAAHYSWQLGIPFSLCYTNRFDIAVLGFAQKHFPKMAQEGSQYCEYNQKGEIKKVMPFMKEFMLLWKNDTIHYVDSDTQKEVTTIVTKKRIEDFYRQVSKMDKSSSLPPRPVNLYADGKAMDWTACDYCPLSQVCDDSEAKGKDIWLNNVKKELSK